MAASSPLLRIDHLVAGYQRPVVGPLSLALHPGEVVGLWGANGSGKSTLLNAVIGSARIWSGAVQRASGLRLAYQEQQPVRLPVMPLSGRDLLRVAGASSAGRDRAQDDGKDDRGAWKRHTHAQSAEVGAIKPPPALGPLLDRRLDQLSGGQYQLLSVWSAIAGGADLILLDEPTNSLDPETEQLLAELLRCAPGHCGILLVSHEHRFLEAACSRVFGLSDLRAAS